MARPSQRFVFIDAWRGIAALMVAVFHLHGIVAPPEFHIVPQPIDWLFRHGDSGVEIFFVLSGFVVTHNVLGAGQVTGGFAGRFALRRSLRLDPPYWLIIGLNLLAAAAIHSHTYDGVGPLQVLANMAYLDNLLGVKSIVAIGWTLCLEIQFYLALVMATWASQRLDTSTRTRAGTAVVFAALFIASVAVGSGLMQNPIPSLFLSHWYLFFLGATVAWTVGSPASRAPIAAMFAAATAVLAIGVTKNAVGNYFALVTALAIFGASRASKLEWAIGGRALQYLGGISYSLYLVHPLVGNRALRFIMGKLGNDAPSLEARWGLLIAGVIASVIAAELLCRFVERPAQRFARRVKLPERAPAALPASP